MWWFIRFSVSMVSASQVIATSPILGKLTPKPDMLTISNVIAAAPNSLLNDEVEGKIVEADPATQKSGPKKAYFIQRFKLSDGQNTIVVAVFSDDQADPGFVQGKLMKIKPGEAADRRPKVTEFKGKKELTVGFGNSIEICDIPMMGSTPESDYVPTQNQAAVTPPSQPAYSPPQQQSYSAPDVGNMVSEAVTTYVAVQNGLRAAGAEYSTETVSVITCNILNRKSKL